VTGRDVIGMITTGKTGTETGRGSTVIVVTLQSIIAAIEKRIEVGKISFLNYVRVAEAGHLPENIIVVDTIQKSPAVDQIVMNPKSLDMLERSEKGEEKEKRKLTVIMKGGEGEREEKQVKRDQKGERKREKR